MSALLAAAALTNGIVPIADLPPVNGDPCAVVDSTHDASDTQNSRFTLDDQVRLVDIGQQDPRGARAHFALSPDGTSVAVNLKSADPDTNRYCLRLVVVAMDGSGLLRELDRGGEFIRNDFQLRDFSSVKAGYDRPNPPRWSPDGTRIAFLKRIGSSTQAWVVAADGETPARQISFLPDDVDSVAWTSDGIGLVVGTRPGIRLEAEAIAREAPNGFLFDERFSPNLARRPIPTGAAATQYQVVSLADGNVRSATPDEAARLGSELPASAPPEARIYAGGADGHRAWVEPKNSEQLLSTTQLVMTKPGGGRLVCDTKDCEGIRSLWWSADGQSLLAMQWTGWATSQTALVRWDVTEPRPRQILLTDDMLIGCMPAGGEVLCAREGADRPRRLVAIDTSSEAERVVFDPNPQLHGKTFGRVQRLRFTDPNGLEGLADLVLPPDHRSGEKHPLVVVQYRSDGFLRGGTGDEVPIHVLANRGFAVLSFARPYPRRPAATAKTDDELVRTSRVNWLSRRVVQTSLETAIDIAIESGAVDPERMGISGFSDGSSTVQWALINSSLFKVATMGSCCEDLFSFAYAAGPRFGQLIRTPGYRFFETGSEKDWKPMSLVLNVDKVHTPILIQAADSEFQSGLDVVTTYALRGRPMELFVLNDETHVKWQPAHRQAIYRRSVDWFEFWLMHRMDCGPGKDEQYRRWMAMAGAPPPEALTCSTPVQVHDCAQFSASARSSRR